MTKLSQSFHDDFQFLLLVFQNGMLFLLSIAGSIPCYTLLHLNLQTLSYAFVARCFPFCIYTYYVTFLSMVVYTSLDTFVFIAFLIYQVDYNSALYNHDSIIHIMNG